MLNQITDTQILDLICEKTGYRVSKYALVDEDDVFRMRILDAINLFKIGANTENPQC